MLQLDHAQTVDIHPRPPGAQRGFAAGARGGQVDPPDRAFPARLVAYLRIAGRALLGHAERGIERSAIAAGAHRQPALDRDPRLGRTGLGQRSIVSREQLAQPLGIMADRDQRSFGQLPAGIESDHAQQIGQLLVRSAGQAVFQPDHRRFDIGGLCVQRHRFAACFGATTLLH